VPTPYQFGPCRPNYPEGWWRIFAATAVLYGQALHHPQWYYNSWGFYGREDWATCITFMNGWQKAFYTTGILPHTWRNIVEEPSLDGDNNRHLDHLMHIAYSAWQSSGSGVNLTQWMFRAYKGPPAPIYEIWATQFFSGKIINCCTGVVQNYPSVPPPPMLVLERPLKVATEGNYTIGDNNPYDLAVVNIGAPCSSSRRYTHRT